MFIQTQKLTHIYSKGTLVERRALVEVDATFEQGSWTALIGSTGSGKTTFIQHLNGLLKPTSGNILINGININSKEMSQQALRQMVGLVFQYPEHQIFETSVYNEVAFGPRNLGWSKDSVRDAVIHALDRVGLDYGLFKDRVPQELSGGEKRRVAIAGVLAMLPQILILDEATAGLDPKGRKMLLNEIASLQKEMGLTIIWVTHNLNEVLDYADNLLVFHEGKVAASGSPEKVFLQADYLEKIGLGVPPLYELEYKLKQKGVKIENRFHTLEKAKTEIIQLLKRGDRL